jgi:hypothetical protein
MKAKEKGKNRKSKPFKSSMIFNKARSASIPPIKIKSPSGELKAQWGTIPLEHREAVDF